MNDLNFLRKILPQVPLNRIWVGWSDGKGGFPGGPADEYLDRMPPHAGHYFCIGSLKPGVKRRRREDIEAIQAFVLDDIGTKCELKSVPYIVETLGPPTWIMETSKNNFQYGWSYNRGVERKNWPRHVAAVGYCVDRWKTDRAGMDPNRLVRLPSGLNLKEGKNEFAVELTQLNEKVQLGLEDLFLAERVEWLSIEDGTEDGGNVGRGGLCGARLEDIGRDIWIDVLLWLDMVKWEQANGLEIECPWSSEHTGKEDGTAYLGGGAFKCHHDHCKDRTGTDFRRFLNEKLKEEGKTVMGLLTTPEERQIEDEYVARQRAETEKIFQEIEEDRISIASAERALTRLVYATRDEKFFDRFNMASMSAKQVDEALWPIQTEVGFIRRGQKSVSNALLSHPKLKRVDHLTYRPGHDLFVKDDLEEGGRKGINTWIPPTLVRAKPGKRLQVIRHHIEKRLFPDQEMAVIVYNWLAAQVQRPFEKCNWMMIVVGVGGTGKDLFFNVLRDLLGHSNVVGLSNENLQDRATRDYAVQHKVIIIEELSGIMARADMANLLKPLITIPPETMTIRLFQERPREVAKTANLLAYSNHLNALNLGTAEERRRYLVYKSPAVALTPGEAAELADAVKQGAGELLGFLWDWDLDGNGWDAKSKPVTQQTETAEDEMMELTLSSAAQQVFALVNEGQLHSRTFIPTSEIQAGVSAARIPQHGISHAIRDGMRAAGFELWKTIKGTSRRVEIDSLRPRVWVDFKGILNPQIRKTLSAWTTETMARAIMDDRKKCTVTDAMSIFDDQNVEEKSKLEH